MRDEWAIRRLPIYDPRPNPHPAPVQDFDAQPVRVLCLNAAWASHVIGVLYRLARSDAWEGDGTEKQRAIDETEKIIAALSSGMDCIVESGGPGEPGQPETCFAGILVEGEEDMGQVVTDIKIVDGKIRVYYGPCCYIDLETSTALTPVGGDLPEPDDPEAPQYSPWEAADYTSCAKASALLRTWTGIIDTILDSAAVAATPDVVMQNVKAAYPYIAFGNTRLLNAVFAGYNVVGQGFASEAENSDFYQTVKADWAGTFAAGAAGITSAEYEAAISIVGTRSREFFSLSAYPTIAGSIQNLHYSALAAIGANDAKNMTAYIPAIGGEDCSYPAPTSEWADASEYDWYVDFDFSTGALWGNPSAGEGAYFGDPRNYYASAPPSELIRIKKSFMVLAENGGQRTGSVRYIKLWYDFANPANVIGAHIEGPIGGAYTIPDGSLIAANAAEGVMTWQGYSPYDVAEGQTISWKILLRQTGNVDYNPRIYRVVFAGKGEPAFIDSNVVMLNGA